MKLNFFFRMKSFFEKIEFENLIVWLKSKNFQVENNIIFNCNLISSFLTDLRLFKSRVKLNFERKDPVRFIRFIFTEQLNWDTLYIERKKEESLEFMYVAFMYIENKRKRIDNLQENNSSAYTRSHRGIIWFHRPGEALTRKSIR